VAVDFLRLVRPRQRRLATDQLPPPVARLLRSWPRLLQASSAYLGVRSYTKCLSTDQRPTSLSCTVLSGSNASRSAPRSGVPLAAGPWPAMCSVGKSLFRVRARGMPKRRPKPGPANPPRATATTSRRLRARLASARPQNTKRPFRTEVSPAAPKALSIQSLRSKYRSDPCAQVPRTECRAQGRERSAALRPTFPCPDRARIESRREAHRTVRPRGRSEAVTPRDSGPRQQT
jgi:hypothetical protein